MMKIHRSCVMLRYLRLYWRRIGKRVRGKERDDILTGRYEEEL